MPFGCAAALRYTGLAGPVLMWTEQAALQSAATRAAKVVVCLTMTGVRPAAEKLPGRDGELSALLLPPLGPTTGRRRFRQQCRPRQGQRHLEDSAATPSVAIHDVAAVLDDDALHDGEP